MLYGSLTYFCATHRLRRGLGQGSLSNQHISQGQTSTLTYRITKHPHTLTALGWLLNSCWHELG